MTPPTSYGQIAYEQHAKRHPGARPWLNLSLDEHIDWNEAADTVVVHAFERVPTPTLLDEIRVKAGHTRYHPQPECHDRLHWTARLLDNLGDSARSAVDVHAHLTRIADPNNDPQNLPYNLDWVREASNALRYALLEHAVLVLRAIEDLDRRSPQGVQFYDVDGETYATRSLTDLDAHLTQAGVTPDRVTPLDATLDLQLLLHHHLEGPTPDLPMQLASQYPDG